MSNLPFWSGNSINTAIQHSNQRSNWAAIQSSITMMQHNAALYMSSADSESPIQIPGILLQTVIIPGDKTEEGLLIEAVALPWFEILEFITKDPKAIYEIDPRKLEEIIAGAYKRADFDITILHTS